MPRARITETGVTEKEEIFCQKYAAGWSWERAYKAAYNCTSKRSWIANVHRLLKKERIRKRIEELRAQNAKDHLYDLRMAMLEAKEAYDLAKEHIQPAAMVAAAKLRAQLAGILVERRENYNRNVNEMSAEEIEKALDKAAQEAGYLIQRLK